MALITNEDQLDIIDEFVIDLESSLGVKHKKVSFESLWDNSPPLEAGGQALREYMENVSLQIYYKPSAFVKPTQACKDSFFHDDYHNFDQFREDYQKRYSKNPYVSPPVRRQWYA